MEDTRNEIKLMMEQLQQERAAASTLIAEIIQPVLDHILDEVVPVLDSVASPPFSFSETPDSPAYCPPEIESEDEAMESAEVGESVSYECTECQRREDNIFEIMMHLEGDHGIPDDEDILRMKVREIKNNLETREMPNSTSEMSLQENNKENM